MSDEKDDLIKRLAEERDSALQAARAAKAAMDLADKWRLEEEEKNRELMERLQLLEEEYEAARGEL